MSGSPFIPRVYQGESQSVNTAPMQSTDRGSDKIGQTILRVQQYIVGALLLLVPVAFIPGLPASLGFDKALVSAVLGLMVAVLAGLSALRYSKTETVLPWALGAFWMFVLVSFISGALSGDIKDSLRGSIFESQTASFLAIMGLLMIVPLVLQKSKRMSMRALMFFGAGSMLVMLYSLSRVIFGEGFPSAQELRLSYSNSSW
jgi:cation transport ATPase